MEVDVLNASLPGVAPNASKVGIEVVGFGNTITAAYMAESEHKGPGGGRFEHFLLLNPDSLTKNGTLIGVGPQNAKIGINLENSKFSDSAMLMSPENRIVFRDKGKCDASIWRDSLGNGHLVFSAGPNGLRVTNSDDTKQILYIHEDGKIDRASLVWQYYWPWIGGASLLLVGLIGACAWLLWRVHRLAVILAPQQQAASMGIDATVTTAVSFFARTSPNQTEATEAAVKAEQNERRDSVEVSWLNALTAFYTKRVRLCEAGNSGRKPY
ncbi:MAG: hypothetical protein SGI92_31645 [Bryobacteraceae bacterium]|nr:hypothetical protein [Bryobacteraceae bacterium]